MLRTHVRISWAYTPTWFNPTHLVRHSIQVTLSAHVHGHGPAHPTGAGHCFCSGRDRFDQAEVEEISDEFGFDVVIERRADAQRRGEVDFDLWKRIRDQMAFY